jgi:hypothetical protein
MTPNDIAAVKKELRELLERHARMVEKAKAPDADGADRSYADEAEWDLEDAFLEHGRALLDSHDKLEADLFKEREASFAKSVEYGTKAERLEVKLTAQKERVQQLKKLFCETAAYMYQYAGATGASVEVLDNLSDIAADAVLPRHDWPYPAGSEKLDTLAAENKALLADVAAHRQFLEDLRPFAPLTRLEALLASPNPGQALLDELDTLAAENSRLEAMLNAAGWFLQPIPPRNWSEENARLRERLEAAENILEQCFFKAECTYGGYTEVAIKTYLAKYATPKEPTDA